MRFGDFFKLTPSVGKSPEDPSLNNPESEMIGPDSDRLTSEAGAKSLKELLAVYEERRRAAEAKVRHEDKDKYDFGGLMQKLVDSIVREEAPLEEKTRRLGKLFKRFDLFFKKYENILDRRLPADQEEKLSQEAFKDTIGDLIYSGDQFSIKVEAVEHYHGDGETRREVHKDQPSYDKGAGYRKNEEMEKNKTVQPPKAYNPPIKKKELV